MVEPGPGGPDRVREFLDRIRASLSSPAPRVLPDAECERRAAVTLLLVPDATGSGAVEPDPRDGTGVSALFVLRARIDGDPWSGHVALPGGRSDPGDADLLETARRETREETGIELGRSAFLGRLDELHPRSHHLPSIGISPFVAWHPSRPDVVESHELAGHLWVPLPELHASGRRSLLLRERPSPREFPTIEFAGAVIWGLTFAVVENFLARLDWRPGRRPGGPGPS